MSHGSSKQIERNTSTYLSAWLRVGELVRQGRSWSGSERNYCFLNTGGTRFANISAAAGIDHKDDARAIGLVDWDHDGDLDYWVSNRNGPQVRFMRNDWQAANDFLAIRLAGTKCNRDAIGARVAVVVDSAAAGANQVVVQQVSHPPANGAELKTGTQTLVKTLRAGSGFLSQSSKWIHFGLGREATIREVRVHWPGGQVERFTGIKDNVRYRMLEGSGEAKPDGAPRKVQLSARATEVPPLSAAARIVVAQRMPVPRYLEYIDLDGQKSTSIASRPKRC